MADKNKILVKAPLKTEYLKNAVSEKVTYLELPDDFQAYSLKEDIKKGGVQFGGVKELTQKKRISRVVSVTADSSEMGLMAVTYLAIHLLNEREYDEVPFGFEDDSDGQWYESKMRLPVIPVSDITGFLRRGSSPFENNGFMMAQAQARSNHQPYWRSCGKEAVCIVINKDSAGSECMDIVSLFARNKNVFVMFIENDDTGFSAIDDIPFGCMDADHFRALQNNFTLSNAADTVNVSFGKNDSLMYYKNVLKQNIIQRGLKVKRGFSYERVVNLARSVDKTSVCEMLDKIINYALKDADDAENMVFQNSTFDFVDYFMRETSDRTNGEDGRKLMEKNLVGIEEIKQQVYDVVNVMKYNRMRNRMNIEGSHYHNVHVMLGAPGTAKTTVAKYMGLMMFDEKLLSDNRFICINGAELKGMYVGHSAPKTKALFENYDVIIIDEVYSIVESDGRTDSFGNEAIAQLIIELEKHSTDKLIIFAGYGGKKLEKKDNRMQAFLDANPGIKSRITSTFYFDSYSADEMVQIFLRIAKNSNYRVQPGSGEIVRAFFEKRVCDKDFGNGREARALLENAVLFAARRTMAQKKDSYTESELMALTVEDVKSAAEKLGQGYGMSQREQQRIGFVKQQQPK